MLWLLIGLSPLVTQAVRVTEIKETLNQIELAVDKLEYSNRVDRTSNEDSLYEFTVTDLKELLFNVGSVVNRQRIQNVVKVLTNIVEQTRFELEVIKGGLATLRDETSLKALQRQTDHYRHMFIELVDDARSIITDEQFRIQHLFHLVLVEEFGDRFEERISEVVTMTDKDVSARVRDDVIEVVTQVNVFYSWRRIIRYLVDQDFTHQLSQLQLQTFAVSLQLTADHGNIGLAIDLGDVKKLKFSSRLGLLRTAIYIRSVLEDYTLRDVRTALALLSRNSSVVAASVAALPALQSSNILTDVQVARWTAFLNNSVLVLKQPELSLTKDCKEILNEHRQLLARFQRLLTNGTSMHNNVVEAVRLVIYVLQFLLKQSALSLEVRQDAKYLEAELDYYSDIPFNDLNLTVPKEDQLLSACEVNDFSNLANLWIPFSKTVDILHKLSSKITKIKTDVSVEKVVSSDSVRTWPLDKQLAVQVLLDTQWFENLFHFDTQFTTPTHRGLMRPFMQGFSLAQIMDLSKNRLQAVIKGQINFGGKHKIPVVQVYGIEKPSRPSNLLSVKKPKVSTVTLAKPTAPTRPTAPLSHLLVHKPRAPTKPALVKIPTGDETFAATSVVNSEPLDLENPDTSDVGVAFNEDDAVEDDQETTTTHTAAVAGQGFAMAGSGKNKVATWAGKTPGVLFSWGNGPGLFFRRNNLTSTSQNRREISSN